MNEGFRSWIHRHLHVLLSFAIGVTVGICILALAYFSTRNRVAAEAVRYGVQVTRHLDIGEDMAWFFCGIVVGASVACLAWWRDVKAQSADLEKADVLNRLTSDPKPPPVPKPKR
jgi:di/tricarboxylate transporter